MHSHDQVTKWDFISLFFTIFLLVVIVYTKIIPHEQARDPNDIPRPRAR